MAKAIRATGVPNYRQARFPIHSDLNLKAWAKYLQNYPDKRLLQYLTYGFPLSIQNPDDLNNTKVTNHYSALQYPEAIEQYLTKEKQLGAIIGPFDSIDYPFFHCSPLLSRPKEGRDRRVILNLSYPQGCSVNDKVSREFFDGSSFSLKFPSVDDIVNQVRHTKPPVLLAKIDVARAFRNLRVDPADAFKFGIQWKGHYYLDLAVAFGWALGSSAFQLASDAIVSIMRDQGCSIFAYIDDFIIVSNADDAERHFHALSNLLDELGLPMNPSKCTPPCRALTCLGIHIDIDKNTLSIDKDKIQEIHQECLNVSTRTTLSRKNFQSLLGKLIYLHKCIKPARTFVNRILAFFRDNHGARKFKLTKGFYQDINWFIRFLPTFNGSTKIFKPRISNPQSLHIDACLTGVGGIWGHRVYAAPVPLFGKFSLNITHLEMLNLLVALRTWGKFWKNSTVEIFCDNMAVVQVVESSKSRDDFLSACIRNIWLLTATWDIDLHIFHIKGKNNTIADALSRIHSHKGIDNSLYELLKYTYIWDHISPSIFNLDLHI